MRVSVFSRTAGLIASVLSFLSHSHSLLATGYLANL